MDTKHVEPGVGGGRFSIIGFIFGAVGGATVVVGSSSNAPPIVLLVGIGCSLVGVGFILIDVVKAIITDRRTGNE